MKEKRITRSIIGLLIVVFSICFVQFPSLAGSFTASASKTTMTVGETANFTATANGCGGKFTVTSSDSSVVSVEGSMPWTENESQSVTIKANKAGTATITLTAASVADSTTAEDITGSKSVTIKVNDPAPSNNNVDNSGANLKSITVAGKTYTNPGTDFTVTVGANVNSTEISAIASSNGAKISGTGSKELVTGTNAVTLTVTAANGATKKYTIRIRRLADTTSTPNIVDNNNNNNQEEPPEEAPQIQELRLTYLRIEDVELIPEFNSEVFEYAVSVTNIEKLDMVAVANVEDAEVLITGNSDLKEGENEILITIKKENQQDVVYKIKVTKTIPEVVPVQEEENNGTGGFLSTTGGKIAASVGGAAVVGVLIFIIAKIRGGSDIASNAARRAAFKKSTFNDFDD